MSFENPSVQSIDRAITILENLSMEKGGFGVTELSKMTALHKSTVHRLLGALMERGYVEKDISTGNYRLGTKILTLTNAVLDRMDVSTISKPYLKELSKNTNEVVHLAIFDGGEAFYIDKVESPRVDSIRMYSQIGKRIPLHCTGVGKVLLSDLDDKTVENLMKTHGMEKFTENTLTNIEDLKKDLKKIRLLGYGYDEIEHEQGIRCAAAPIYKKNGKIAAAISVSGPTFYVTPERMPQIVEELLKTTAKISNQLAYL